MKTSRYTVGGTRFVYPNSLCKHVCCHYLGASRIFFLQPVVLQLQYYVATVHVFLLNFQHPCAKFEKPLIWVLGSTIIRHLGFSVADLHFNLHLFRQGN